MVKFKNRRFTFLLSEVEIFFGSLNRMSKTIFNLVFAFGICLQNITARDLMPPPKDMRPPALVPKLIQNDLDIEFPENEQEVEEENQVFGELFLVDESLDQVLRLLGDLTGKKIIAGENLPKPQINFDSRGELSRQEAIVAIETLLNMNGVAIARLGDTFLRAIPTGILKNSSPDVLEDDVQSLLPSEKMYTKHFRVNYLSWEEANQLITGRLSANGGTLEAIQSSGTLLITDTLVNLQSIENLLEEVDVPSEKEIIVKKLKNITAQELKSVLDTALEGSLKAFYKGKIAIEADERTNQLVFVTDPRNKELIEDLVKTYDIDAEPLTTSKIIYVKHAESTEVVTLLNDIVTSSRDSNSRNGGRPRDGANPPAANQTDPAINNPIGDLSERNVRFSEYLSMVADVRSNSIIVYGTPGDIEFVADLIEEIDVLLAQVRIDVVIAEVTLTDEESRGLESFGISYDENDEIRFALNDGSDVGWNLEGSVEDLFLRSWTVAGFTLASVFETAKRDSNVNVLSAPTLVTTHNREAVINAGESRPVITATNTDSTGINTRSQVQFKDIGIRLKVKPLIGQNGMVQMEVEQTVESVVDEVLIDGNSQPVIGKREATSFISVSSGELIVLGGLQENSIRNVKGKMAILGDLPFLGDALFSSDRKRNIRRELVIFIKPTVYFDSESAIKDTQKRLMESETNVLTGDYVDQKPVLVAPEEANTETNKEGEKANDFKRSGRRGFWRR